VPESPVFQRRAEAGERRSVGEAMRGRWGLFAYLIVLMALFNMFSHGSQDVYPTFLKLQMHFDTHVVSLLTIVLNLGALVGGLVFGAWSEHIGRRRAMVISALFALPAIPLWSYGGSLLLLAIGAFWIQVAVQGAWGVVPSYLNELSPDDVRGTLPGFADDVMEAHHGVLRRFHDRVPSRQTRMLASAANRVMSEEKARTRVSADVRR
jgi:SHS family lactate transporter-like MFS transporter